MRNIAILTLLLLACTATAQRIMPDNRSVDFRGKYILRQGAIMGDSGQTACALLELKSTNKTLLLTRLTDTQMNAISSPAHGLMTYNTDHDAVYFYEGSRWLPVARFMDSITVGYGSYDTINISRADIAIMHLDTSNFAPGPLSVDSDGNVISGDYSCGWNLQGNSGTDPEVDFIGTNDVCQLKFKVGGEYCGILDCDYNNTAFGFQALKLGYSSTSENVAIGTGTLSYATSGNGNTVVGNGAMSGAISPGSANVAIGANALLSAEGNTNLTAIGPATLANCQNSTFNIAVGTNALSAITYGNYNIAIGRTTNRVMDSNDTINYSISIGDSTTAVSNQLTICDSILQVKLNLNSGASGSVLTNDGNGIGTWQTPRFVSADSVTIYALTPVAGTTYYCTNCSGSGVTGRIVTYIGGLWRRLKFD